MKAWFEKNKKKRLKGLKVRVLYKRAQKQKVHLGLVWG